jgi:hypothetical protein
MGEWLTSLDSQVFVRSVCYGDGCHTSPKYTERLMTTLPQVAAAMQYVLTEVADRAGRQSGMVQRSDAKLTGSIFTQTLVFGLGAHPHASLSNLTQVAADLGVRVSTEALHQRFDREAATCLEQVLYAAVRQVIAADPVVLPVLERFTEVVVQDSTTITLPEALAPVWAGCGGAPHAGNAALKLNLALDLCTGRLRGPHLHDGRESDRNATLHHDLEPGSVRIVDLGFWDLAVLAELLARGIYSFSRAQEEEGELYFDDPSGAAETNVAKRRVFSELSRRSPKRREDRVLPGPFRTLFRVWLCGKLLRARRRAVAERGGRGGRLQPGDKLRPEGGARGSEVAEVPDALEPDFRGHEMAACEPRIGPHHRIY